MQTSTAQAPLEMERRAIQDIPSAILRENLTTKIENIHRLIKETEMFDPDLALTALKDRFFTYLTSSCEKRPLLVRRAIWIDILAGVLQNKMIEFRERNRVQSIDSYSHIQYADMIEMVVTMAELVGAYVQSNPAEDNYASTELMNEIVEIATNTKTAQSEHYYDTVRRYGEKIIARLRNTTAMSRGSVTLSYSLENELTQFRTRLRSYRNRVVV